MEAKARRYKTPSAPLLATANAHMRVRFHISAEHRRDSPPFGVNARVYNRYAERRKKQNIYLFPAVIVSHHAVLQNQRCVIAECESAAFPLGIVLDRQTRGARVYEATMELNVGRGIVGGDRDGSPLSGCGIVDESRVVDATRRQPVEGLGARRQRKRRPLAYFFLWPGDCFVPNAPITTITPRVHVPSEGI